MKRVSKDRYYLNIAKEAAKRGTCLSAVFGAVIVNNDSIVPTGDAGAPRKISYRLQVNPNFYKIGEF